ncbi:MAG: hypothetical protein QM496_13865 [Verrucomicrobiota bacterium]
MSEAKLSSNDWFCILNDDGTIDLEMLEIGARNSHKEANEKEMEKALELSSAGWTQEQHVCHPFTKSVDVMSWYWRRPARRKGMKGRLFLSTNQAYNAMNRESLRNEGILGA